MNARLPDTATLRVAIYLTGHGQVSREAAYGAMFSLFSWGGLKAEERFRKLWADAHHDTPVGAAARDTLRASTGIQIQLEAKHECA